MRVMILQSAACLLCAVASGCMLRRWWRLDDYDRGRIWKHYGLFCGLMCCGSCTGAVTYAAFFLCFNSYDKSFITDPFGDAVYDYSVYSLVRFALQLLCNCGALNCTPWRVAKHT
jgi:hypothetical protein